MQKKLKVGPAWGFLLPQIQKSIHQQLPPAFNYTAVINHNFKSTNCLFVLCAIISIYLLPKRNKVHCLSFIYFPRHEAPSSLPPLCSFNFTEVEYCWKTEVKVRQTLPITKYKNTKLQKNKNTKIQKIRKYKIKTQKNTKRAQNVVEKLRSGSDKLLQLVHQLPNFTHRLCIFFFSHVQPKNTKKR